MSSGRHIVRQMIMTKASFVLLCSGWCIPRQLGSAYLVWGWQNDPICNQRLGEAIAFRKVQPIPGQGSSAWSFSRHLHVMAKMRTGREKVRREDKARPECRASSQVGIWEKRWDQKPERSFCCTTRDSSYSKEDTVLDINEGAHTHSHTFHPKWDSQNIFSEFWQLNPLANDWQLKLSSTI